MAVDDSSARVQCPCDQWGNTSEIYDALHSCAKTNEVVDWLCGSLERAGQRPSCSSSSSRCISRVSTSFALLNEIRHVCREYVEDSNPMTPDVKAPHTKAPQVTDQTAFPSLSQNIGTAETAAPNVLIARKKPNPKKQVVPAQQTKPLRRIPPMQVSSNGAGNIAQLNSDEPLSMNNLAITSADGMRLGDDAFVSGKSNALTSQETMLRQGKPSPNTSVWAGASLTTTQTNSSIDSQPSQVPLQLKHSESDINSGRGLQSQDGGSQCDNGRPVQQMQPNAWAFQSPPSKSPPMPNKAPLSGINKSKIDNLAKVYTTLIMCSLVPSTPLELHLLIGLLTLEDSGVQKPKQPGVGSILVSPEACREFAIQSLTYVKPILSNLHLHVLSALVQCPPVRDLLPDVTTELTTRVQERQRNLIISESGFTEGIQPILTVPFDENRDSSHNYKSRDETALYKNREESRDAFLYQLRFFQNVRGRVLDTSELESSLLRIRHSASNVIQGVQVQNMHWFAQLFSNLLLQIGLVPMEETDKELLKIADKDKLQRLHKRFSSKVGPSKGRSVQVLSVVKDEQSLEKETHQCFPGHQEFFFIFLQAADSYNFGVHLKSRLVAGIKDLEGQNDINHFQERLARQQLLAKFLGVLLFSPNWHPSGVSDVLKSVSSDDLEVWTNVTEIPLPLCDYINNAQNEHRLLGTIPWILELLRMAKWDKISTQSQSIQSVVAKLISLRNRIQTNLSPNLQLIVLCLESFVHEVGCLRFTHSLPLLPKSEQILATPEDTVDVVELQLSKNFLFASIFHMEELHSLIMSITSNRSKSAGTPRKMRPSIVSASISSFSSLPPGEDVVTLSKSLKPGILSESTSAKTRIVGKLVDLFFHQHGDLKEICEFVIARSVQKAMANVQQQLRNYLQTVEYDKFVSDDGSMSSELEQEALARSFQSFRASLLSTVGPALRALSPPTKSSKVNEIATTLAINHAVKLSGVKVDALVKLEMNKQFEVKLRSWKKSHEFMKANKRT